MREGDKINIKGKQYQIQIVYNCVYDENTFYLVPMEKQFKDIKTKVFDTMEELEQWVKEKNKS